MYISFSPIILGQSRLHSTNSNEVLQSTDADCMLNEDVPLQLNAINSEHDIIDRIDFPYFRFKASSDVCDLRWQKFL